MRLALFQPDIPQNAGTLMRLCACLGVPLDVIEPCGFLLTDRNLRRAGMDYIARLDMTRQAGWEAFARARAGSRLVLLTTRPGERLPDFSFRTGDVLIAGRESAGVPDAVRDACAARVTIPMAQGARSLNVAVAAAMALGEALRQTGLYPCARGGNPLPIGDAS